MSLPTRHWHLAGKGLCIAISHGGLSTLTVRALAAARATGAKTALITAAGHTPAEDLADVVLVTPLRDKSYCHTVGYTSPMLTGFYLASAYRQEEFPAADLAGSAPAAHDALRRRRSRRAGPG